MKRNRLIYFILWIFSLVGISFYGGAVSYGFFTMLTILPFILFIYLLAVFVFFRIYQQIDSRNLVAGRPVPFYFTLMNEYHFGFCSIKVHFFSSYSKISSLDDDTEYELLPHSGIKKDTQLICRYRGEYEVGIKTVEITDFLRLFRFRYNNKETLRVAVKPDLIKLEEIKSMDLSQTMFRNAFVNPTEPDIEVRKYSDGDDVRMINWKASARSGELLVRKMIAREREGVCVINGTKRIDGDMSVYLPLENKILELTIALAYYFASENISVSSLYLDGELRENNVRSLDDFDSFYERASGMIFRTDSDEDKLLTLCSRHKEVYSCKSVFLVLHEWSAAAEEFVHSLRDNNVFTLACIIDNEVKDHEGNTGIPGFVMKYIGVEQELASAGI